MFLVMNNQILDTMKLNVEDLNAAMGNTRVIDNAKYFTVISTTKQRFSYRGGIGKHKHYVCRITGLIDESCAYMFDHGFIC